MPTPKLRALAAVAAAALLFLSLGHVPVSANPHDARITGVFRTSDCAKSGCVPGSDPALKAGSVAGGVLQVNVSAQADLGLEWVRLEANVPGDPRWYCLEFWNAERATTFDNRRVWHTTHWTDPREECRPEDCSGCAENSPHYHGAPTTNVEYSLRVVAHEQGSNVSGSTDDVSSAFKFRLQNAPSAPAWVEQPSSSGSADGHPAVKLQWAPSAEPDVLEYRFVRLDPNGRRTAYAVSARTPEAQGCDRIGTLAYRCIDTSFPSANFGGTYRYAIQAARRASTGDRCELSAGPCIASGLGEPRAVTVAAGPPATPGPGRPGPGGVVPSTGARSRSAAPVALATAPGTADDLLPASKGKPWLAAAGGLLALALGTVIWASFRSKRAPQG